MKKKIEKCLCWTTIVLFWVVEILGFLVGVSSVPIIEECLDNAICSKYPALTTKEVRYVILLWDVVLVQLVVIALFILSWGFKDKNKEGKDDEKKN